MLTAYNVISSDGFIAQADGSEDFIPDEVWDDFLELLTEYAVLIIGKNTYDTIQSFDQKLIEDFGNVPIKKIIVTRDESFVPKTDYEKMSSLQDAAAMSPNTLLSSGPGLNTAFLKEKLIDRIILNKLPVAIGTGIRQFETDMDPDLIPLPEPSRKTKGGRTLEFYEVNYI
jgi:dihydrofolate reductase